MWKCPECLFLYDLDKLCKCGYNVSQINNLDKYIVEVKISDWVKLNQANNAHRPIVDTGKIPKSLVDKK